MSGALAVTLVRLIMVINVPVLVVQIFVNQKYNEKMLISIFFEPGK